jgi:hypothetical protein
VFLVPRRPRPPTRALRPSTSSRPTRGGPPLPRHPRDCQAGLEEGSCLSTAPGDEPVWILQIGAGYLPTHGSSPSTVRTCGDFATIHESAQTGFAPVLHGFFAACRGGPFLKSSPHVAGPCPSCAPHSLHGEVQSTQPPTEKPSTQGASRLGIVRRVESTCWVRSWESIGATLGGPSLESSYNPDAEALPPRQHYIVQAACTHVSRQDDSLGNFALNHRLVVILQRPIALQLGAIRPCSR